MENGMEYIEKAKIIVVTPSVDNAKQKQWITALIRVINVMSNNNKIVILILFDHKLHNGKKYI